MSSSIQPRMKFSPGFVELYNEYNNTERGQRLLELSGISRRQLDVAKMTSEYFVSHTGDMSIDPNANIGNSKCPNNFSAEVVKGVSKLTAFHLLWSRAAEEHGPERASELISRVWKGAIYFHDLTGHGVTAPYCFAVSTLPLIMLGRPYGQLHSTPPKRASSFIAQAIEFTMDMSQEFMGAIGLADILVNYAMLAKGEGVDPSTSVGFKKIENDFQQLVHVVNNGFRMSAQSPFTNISLFDRPQLKAIFEEYEYPSGLKAVDHVEYIMEVQNIFMKFMAKKDPISGFPYRFPIVTVNITTKKGKALDDKFLGSVCKSNTEGVFNIYITEGIGKVASCCRLLSDIKQMKERQRADVWGNGGVNIGSTRVCTINLARPAFESSGPTEFRASLRRIMEDARDLLLTHRKILEEMIESGYLKFFKPLNWISLDMMFSTFGIVGLFEALVLFGEEYILPAGKGIEKAEEILKYVDELANEFSEATGVPFNVEQIPAEGSAITLAKQDKVFFPNSPFKIYSNQSIPLWIDVDLITRARVDGHLTKCYSGGGISHLNIGTKATPQQIRSLIEFAIEKGLDHFALNPVFSQCENGHTTLGKSDVCPECGAKITSKVTRIIGYFTPIQNWASVRREWEFPRRVWGSLYDHERELKVTPPVDTRKAKKKRAKKKHGKEESKLCKG